MIESYISINVIGKNNTLKNKNGIPLLYYYNGNDNDNIKNNIIASLSNDDNFMNFIYQSVFSVEDYSYSKLSFFYFDKENIYNEYNINIQDTFPLIKYDNPKDSLKYNYIKHILGYLYKCSYKQDYMFNNDNLFDSIYYCWIKLKEKNPNKIEKNTVINYIKSELNNIYLSEDNINVIIDILQNDDLIKDNE